MQGGASLAYFRGKSSFRARMDCRVKASPSIELPAARFWTSLRMGTCNSVPPVRWCCRQRVLDRLRGHLPTAPPVWCCRYRALDQLREYLLKLPLADPQS